MQIPLVISFKGMPSSDAAEARIRREATKLDRFYDRITSCQVTIEEPHRHRNQGRLFAVRIHLTLPHDKDLVVRRAPDQRQAHEDPYVAIRDAFDAARRQLQDRVRIRRGEVKAHEAPPQGRVARLVPDEGYGFIETAEGVEIYFHRNSVVNAAFETLAPGMEVRFAEEMGEKGPQASTVQLAEPHRARRTTKSTEIEK